MPSRQSSLLRFAPPPPLRACVPPSTPAPVPTPISKLTVKLIIKSRAPELELGFLGPRLKTEAFASNLVALHKSLDLNLITLFSPSSDNHLSFCIVFIATIVSDDFRRNLPLRIEICWNKRIFILFILFKDLDKTIFRDLSPTPIPWVLEVCRNRHTFLGPHWKRSLKSLDNLLKVPMRNC